MPAVPPSEITRLGKSGLKITWSDGLDCSLTAKALRTNCPCAQCREERGDASHAKPLGASKPAMLKVIEHSQEEQLALSSIWAVGNYALGMRWGDGHDSGIYTYELLRQLCLSSEHLIIP